MGRPRYSQISLEEAVKLSTLILMVKLIEGSEEESTIYVKNGRFSVFSKRYLVKEVLHKTKESELNVSGKEIKIFPANVDAISKTIERSMEKGTFSKSDYKTFTHKIYKGHGILRHELGNFQKFEEYIVFLREEEFQLEKEKKSKRFSFVAETSFEKVERTNKIKEILA